MCWLDLTPTPWEAFSLNDAHRSALTVGGVIVPLPVSLPFILVQRNLIAGLTGGSMKSWESPFLWRRSEVAHPLLLVPVVLRACTEWAMSNERNQAVDFLVVLRPERFGG